MRRIAISVLVLCAALFGAQHQPSAQFIPPGFPPGVFLNRGAIDAAPNGGGWTPASLGANLVGWYDASQPVYTDTGCSTGATNGQSIQCVPDQSGNAYNVQDNFTTQSTLNTTGYNGHRVLSWSAGGGNLQTTTSPVTQFENGTVASVCAVAKISLFYKWFSWRHRGQRGHLHHRNRHDVFRGIVVSSAIQFRPYMAADAVRRLVFCAGRTGQMH
jgi:hypothetical protein